MKHVGKIFTSLLLSFAAIQISAQETTKIPYEVTVGNETLELNIVKEQYHEGEYYWGRFDTKGKVKVAVKSEFDLTDVKVVAGGKVDWSVENNSLILTAKGPFKAVIEPKGRIKPLLLFADRPEVKRPQGPSVKYFAPGEHNVGVLEVTDGQVVYLDEGALVNGAIHATGDNILICGRGVLSGASYPRLQGPLESLLLADKCKDLIIRDVTFTAPWWWTVYILNCERVVFDNIKILNSNMINDDGIDIANSRNVTVKNSFIRSQDDVIAVKGMDASGLPCENILVEDCMLWNDWANVIRVGYECEAPYMKNIVVRNCDVVHYAFRYKEPHRFWTNTVFYLQPSNNMEISDLLFENIRIHADGNFVFLRASADICTGPAILGLEAQHYSKVYSVADLGKYKYPAAGSLDKVLFKNICVLGDCSVSCGDIYLKGRSEKESIGTITFDNVTFFGTPVKESENKKLQIGKFVTEPIYR